MFNFESSLLMLFNEIKEKLKVRTVGIAGCGGLGSNCAIALARTGTGKLIIADFDIVTESNLNRQYFFLDQVGMKKVDALKQNINRINPDVNVITYHTRLTAKNIIKIYNDCDVIVEAFDLAQMKEMIIETVLLNFPDKYIISGVGIAGWGKNNLMKTSRYDNLFICGDNENEVTEEMPPLAPRVGIAACMQANQVLELLLKD